jgi:hypothetical protein
MQIWEPLMRILPLALALAILGCAHEEKLSDQPDQAALQVRNWIPIGTSLADARQIMELHHFTCSEITNGNFANLKFADYLYCDRRMPDSHLAPGTMQRWQAALVLTDGKVSDVLVMTGLVGS